MAREQNARLTRRRLLQGTAAGLVAGGVAAMPAQATSVVAPLLSPAPDDAQVTVDGPLVAYVQDAASGEVTLLIGTEEVVARNPDLVAQLVRAAQQR